eukprot:scaffold5028_cov69-Cylindrotheca_fusiformis.AAC.2
MSGNRRQTKRQSSDNKNSAPPAKKKERSAEQENQEMSVSEDSLVAELKARIAELESKRAELESKRAELESKRAAQESDEKKQSLETLRYVQKPFVNGDHQPAKAREATLNLLYPKDSVLQSMQSGSLLLQQFVDQESIGSKIIFRERYYSSEADVCGFVKNAVDDAISILEVERTFQPSQLRTTLERGLFSCRPDVMVVRSETGMAYLAVEVKQPVPKNPEGEQRTLVQFPRVLGHAFDHAMAMDAFGMGSAIVIITSFEE